MQPLGTDSAFTTYALLTRQLKRQWWLMLLTLVTLSMLGTSFRHELRLQQFDNVLYDWAIRLQPSATTPSNIAIIAIDDDSIAQLGFWPWRRTKHAELLPHLSEAKAVGFDVLFSEANPNFPQDDDAFAQAIATHGRVVLPLVIDPNTQTALPPFRPFDDAAAATGYINVYPDHDGVVRRLQLAQETNDQAPYSHLIVALLQAAGEAQQAKALLKSMHSATRLLPFQVTTQPAFKLYRYADVLAGVYSPEEFANRYVLVGAWSSGLGDLFSTPLATPEQPLQPGVSILAHGLHSALTDNWIRVAPLWLLIVLNALPVVLVCVALLKRSPRQALALTAGLLMALLGCAWVGVYSLHIKLSIVPSLIATILAYPIWHWRSQETTLRYVDHELNVLSQQDPSLRTALSARHQAATLPARLSFLQHGIELLRDSQQRREQTLRFISHDMRAPQNAILALIALTRAQNHSNSAQTLASETLLTIEHYAQTTLRLVDEFMALAKAEAIQLEFNECNLNDLCAQCCDELWPLSEQKSIRIEFIEPDTPIYAFICEALYKRALLNLLDNALKYSAAQTTVRCTLSADSTHFSIQIQDQGWGIPAAQVATIFQPFQRAHTDHAEVPLGSGIGLAFVETVVLRHQGTIHCSSQEQVGTTFSIRQPLQPV